MLNPTARAEVFRIESHEEYCVYRIDDGIADSALLREVGAFVTDWVVFVSAHGVSLCFSFQPRFMYGRSKWTHHTLATRATDACHT